MSLAIESRIWRWHREAFPEATVQDVALKAIEESIELALAEHVEPERIADLVRVELRRKPSDDPISEAVDVLFVALCLARFDPDLRFRLPGLLERNRSRVGYWDAHGQRKPSAEAARF